MNRNEVLHDYLITDKFPIHHFYNPLVLKNTHTTINIVNSELLS